MTEAPTSEARRAGLVAEIVVAIRDDPALATRIQPETDLIVELGLDSLEITELLLGLEDRLGHEVDLEGIAAETLHSVRALCRATMGPADDA